MPGSDEKPDQLGVRIKIWLVVPIKVFAQMSGSTLSGQVRLTIKGLCGTEEINCEAARDNAKSIAKLGGTKGNQLRGHAG